MGLEGRRSKAVRCAVMCVAALLVCSTAMVAETPQAGSRASAVAAADTDGASVPVHQVADDPRTAMTVSAADAETQTAFGAAKSSSLAPALPAASGEPAKSQLPAVPPPIPAAPEPDKYNVSLIGHRSVGTGLNFYSLEREMALGQDLAKQVEQSSKLVSDPEINEYINRVGQNLVRNSDSRVPFTIKVIDSGEINAFALPGGYFYVDSGLILAANSEAELAAIMAHEIAHVAARHATKNMTKQQIWNMASIPLMFVGGPAGFAIAEVASIAVPMSFLKFSRDSEREADMLGLQYDYAAGYDPQAFIQFFERLKAEQKQKHGKIAKLFSTHPMTADRITAAQGEIQKYFPDRDSYIVDTSEFSAMKTRLLTLQGRYKLDGDAGAVRPVLRKHQDDAAPANTVSDGQPQASAQSDQPDDGPPTLKRASSNPD